MARQKRWCDVDASRVKHSTALLCAIESVAKADKKLVPVHGDPVALPFTSDLNKPKHDENCDSLDNGPDGIKKPCNCGASKPELRVIKAEELRS